LFVSTESALALTYELWSEFWSALYGALYSPVCGEHWGGLGLVTLAQRVRGAGAGLEVDGFLQQARDALHLEFD
jgi:hypothetical protein